MAAADPQRRFAVELFNGAWEYLANEARSSDDEAAMLAAALGSWHHWRQIGTPDNFAISDWQVSRVFAVLGDAGWARRFAQSNLDLCDQHDLGPFYRAYAYEALARAAAVGGDADAAERHVTAARDIADSIDDAAERQAVLDDLATI